LVATERATAKSKAPRHSGAELERVEVNSRAEWRWWLAAHHRQLDGVWLVTIMAPIRADI
jgi:hypothetical protein